ncbi:MAG: hypothetical protein IPJ04_09750 [Candidatus Eisenbacteria bacterium]|nr:hypothetical protein [Candidatus Eisenbacteria bacterium]
MTPLRRATLGAAGAALLLSAALAAPAFALPDYLPFTLGGWANPLVVRTTSDATPSSALNSPALTGGTTSYFSAAIANTGASAGLATSTGVMQVDGSTYQVFSVPALSPSTAAVGMNLPVIVEGGLHTVSVIADATGQLSESNEGNNTHARQLSFTPVDLLLHTHVTRNAPPEPTAGTGAVSGTVYPNQDGVRLPADDKPWDAVALTPPAGSDYDLYFYDATTGTGDGFRTPLGQSLVGPGLTDFVLHNGNFVGAPPRDVGIQYYSGSLLSYGIEHRNAEATISRPTTLSGLSLESDQMLWVGQYQHIPNGSEPRVLFTLTSAPGTVLHLAIYDPAVGPIYSRSSAMATAATDGSGIARLDLTLPRFGGNIYYGVAVFRDQADGGTAATTFSLSIRATPADLSNARRTDLTEPVNATNHGLDLSDPPTALDGDAATTTMSTYWKNVGTMNAGTYTTGFFLDGFVIDSFTLSTLAGDLAERHSAAPFQVRGGRHTLSYVVDTNAEVDEFDETNNTYGKQFVWSPLAMQNGVPLTRSMPPEPTGGHTAIPASVTKYPNVDGLRASFVGLPGPLVSVLTPGAGSDVDLQWFPLSTDPANGFEVPTIASARGTGLTDLLIDTRTDTSVRQHDVGALRFSGASVPYTIQSQLAPQIVIAGPALGAAILPPGALVSARWGFPAPGTSKTVVLENLSSDVDLALAVFRLNPGGVANLNGTVTGGFADYGGPGRGEIATISGLTSAEPLVFVVFKAGSADVAKQANFNLWIDPGYTDAGDVLPQELSFALASANPSHGPAQLRFALPSARDVSIDVLDVSGRRVRTLASGRQEAGTHSVEWNGADEQGRALPNGTYFARFASGADRRTAKVLLLR